MAARFFPEDSVTMFQALYTWVRGELAGPPVTPAVWKKQGAPSPPLPYVALDLIVPPTEEGTLERTTNGFAVRVDTVLNATLYTVTINGVAHDFTSSGAATAESIRDGLIAAINDGAEPVVAASFQTDAFTLLPEGNELPPEVAVDANLELAAPEILLGYAVATLAVDVFDLKPGSNVPSAPPAGRSAASTAKRLELSLDKSEVIAALSAAGWAVVTIEDNRIFDEFADGQWEDRAGFDLRLRCRTRVVDVVGFVEHALVGQGIVGTLSP